MLPKTNIETQLRKVRARRGSPDLIMAEVSRILSENQQQRDAIAKKILNPSTARSNQLKWELLPASQVFHIDDIKELCVTYRLRFLDAQYFKGPIPEEAITKIRELEKQHETSLAKFKIVAPAKLLKLENADDPLLFAPLGNDLYYLVHKWGNDLHPLRKWLMWPYKSFENLLFCIFILSLALTAVMPMHLFSKNVTAQEYVLMAFFMFKAVGGIVLYYGFAKGKNFNSAIWKSKYYNA
jgi:hypothetical protein